jgi:ABC-2 type transport system ATP-binding protein
MLEQTKLRERADDAVSRLSVGNRQRVNIAIGLLSSPQVLLLDEPTAALDPRQRERLWEFICALAAAGTGIVYATHNVLEAERYADRVLVLADGERLFWGEPVELTAAVADYGTGEGPAGFEAAFVTFLRQRGH